jgi:predicted amidophosphoribosyltransferase
MNCPYCRSDIAEDALVCAQCGRDFAVPSGLIAERDGLSRKRDSLRDELRRVQAEIAMIKKRRKSR